MNWNDLIAIARVLASGALPPLTGRPRRAEISRAISTIYYAAFHALANNNANTLIGSGYQARNDPAWMLTYRTIDHRSARARCQHPAMSRFPIEIIEMADLFVRLQAARHRADYAPQAQDSRSEVLQMATETETELTIRAFEAADPTQRRSFAATCSSGKGATDGSRKRWHCPVNRAGGGAAVPLHRMAGPGRAGHTV